MKKLLFIFALFLSGVSFANPSVELISEELSISNLDFETKTINPTDDGECYATCSVTVINTETGETVEISGFAHSYISCELAGAACLKNATKKARAFIAEHD